MPLTDYPLLLIIAIVVLLASDALLFLLGCSLRRGAGNLARAHETIPSQQDLAMMRQSLHLLSESIARLEGRLGELEGRQEQIESGDPERQSYGVAMRLVGNGADINELMSVCGLARGEAELIVKLHEMNSAHCSGAR